MTEKNNLSNKSIGDAPSSESLLRPISGAINPLSRSDGSAVFGIGGTSAIAAVVGPVEVKSQNLKIDGSHIECIYRPKAGLPTVCDKVRESLIKSACETAIITNIYPRTLISIQVQELDDCFGIDACVINAACLALIAAGIPLKFTFAAVHCIVNQKGEIIVDPDKCQYVGKVASLTFVFDSVERDILKVQSDGHFKITQFIEAEKQCRQASETIFNFYRKEITEFLQNSCLTVSQKKTKSNEQKSE